MTKNIRVNPKDLRGLQEGKGGGGGGFELSEFEIAGFDCISIGILTEY